MSFLFSLAAVRLNWGFFFMTVVATVISQHAAVSPGDHGLRDDPQHNGLPENNVVFETALEPTGSISESLPGHNRVDADAFDPGNNSPGQLGEDGQPIEIVDDVNVDANGYSTAHLFDESRDFGLVFPDDWSVPSPAGDGHDPPVEAPELLPSSWRHLDGFSSW